MLFLYIRLLVLFFALGRACSASGADFQQRVDASQIQTVTHENGLRVTFFGTSSFLLEDEETQILIDGFFTRTEHGLFGKFYPDPTQIDSTLQKHHICTAGGGALSASYSHKCGTKRLQYIIPTHGHYDHALDAPYIAARTGANLIGDASIEAVVSASKKFWKFQNRGLDWSTVKTTPPFLSEDQDFRRLPPVGRFNIALIRTSHNVNPSTIFLSGTTSDELSFPSTLWSMKQGATFSVYITYGNERLLIVPSAGSIGAVFQKHRIEADVVFLGIGGLGFKLPNTRRKYWNDVVTAVRASRVIPIHWDDDQRPMDVDEGKNFWVVGPRRFQQTMRILDKLAVNCGIEIVFAPAAKSFDPFTNFKVLRSSKTSSKCYSE